MTQNATITLNQEAAAKLEAATAALAAIGLTITQASELNTAAEMAVALTEDYGARASVSTLIRHWHEGCY